MMALRQLLIATVVAALYASAQTLSYTIDDIRYASVRDFALSRVVMARHGRPRSTSAWSYGSFEATTHFGSHRES